MAATKFKKSGDKRDGKMFVALPTVVLGSPGYRLASHPARSLLVDIASQYTGHNNGKLVACAKFLGPLGWRSNSTAVRAVHDLLECGLLIETRKGARPNKAAWYALSWLDLDQQSGLDIDPRLYQRCHRGAYLRPDKMASIDNSRTLLATESRKAVASELREAKQSTSLTPSHGIDRPRIEPSHGVTSSIATPSDGAIQGGSSYLSTPSDGAYLEIPSTPAWLGSVASGVAPSLSRPTSHQG